MSEAKNWSEDGRTRRRKLPGTGIHDTSEATYKAMREEYIHGREPLTDICRRHGVLYGAAHQRLRMEGWEALRPPLPPPPPVKTTRSRPACPSCGAGSWCAYIRFDENIEAFKCSSCGRLWERAFRGANLRVIQGGKAPEARS